MEKNKENEAEEENNSTEENDSTEDNIVSDEEAQGEDLDVEWERRREARRARMRRRKRRRKAIKVTLLSVFLAAAAAAVLYYTDGVVYLKRGGEIIAWYAKDIAKQAGDKIEELREKRSSDQESSVETLASDEQQAEVTPEPTIDPMEEIRAQQQRHVDELLVQAESMAVQYDYPGAAALLQGDDLYGERQELQDAAAGYLEMYDNCVSWPLDQITHVFYHTLIRDTSKAFDNDYKAAGYNQVMTTVDEFNKITQSMYDRGYVMVSLYDMASVNQDGIMTAGDIRLPEGKIPFVLSQDDVSYYHYMDGDGCASKLIVDEEGKVRNEYIEDDGSVSVGDYDMIPLIDRFVEAHPDFSYRGTKGIIALTGYNGILGYRTDISYQTRPDDLDAVKVAWLDAHPDFSLEEERAGAKKVVDAMKAEGWLFASHTWGHLDVRESSLERLQADTNRFKENVDPLIGGTDIIIFAFGADLNDAGDYSGDKFEYFKSMGYNYFCNVDSSKYFVQLHDRYLRQGRRNLDGYRMYYNPDMLSDLFDVSQVWDTSRPVPVQQME